MCAYDKGFDFLLEAWGFLKTLVLLFRVWNCNLPKFQALLVIHKFGTEAIEMMIECVVTPLL